MAKVKPVATIQGVDVWCNFDECEPTDKIIPNPRNPNTHSEDQINRLAVIIKYQGWRSPIVVSTLSGFIVKGHCRLSAAAELKLKQVPVEYQDYENEAAEWADMVADNVIAELAVADGLKMADVINDLDTANFNLDLTGLDKAQIDDYIHGPMGTEGLTDDDAVPEPPKKAKTNVGDLWILGDHRLLCGDSTDKACVERLMGGEKAELLFTSPPYVDMRDYGGNDLSVKNLKKFILEFYRFAQYQIINLGIKRDKGEIVQYWDEYIKQEKDCGYKFLSWNVWNRQYAKTIGQQKAFFPIAHEWLLVFGKEKKRINKTRKKADRKDMRKVKVTRNKDGSLTKRSAGDISNPLTEITTVSTIQPHLARNVDSTHPAMFSVELPFEYIKAMTSNKQSVIDPFLGSGSTLIACEKTGRKCYGMEIDPIYCDVIVKRWEDYTGRKAKLDG